MRNRVRLILTLLLVLLLAGLFGRTWLMGPRIGPGSFLLVNLGGTYAEAPPTGIVEHIFHRNEHTLLGLVHLFKKAAADDRIKGIVLHVTKLDIGWAKAQDIRDALLAFRKSGKQVVAYLEQEVSSGNLEYYVASAAGKVYLPPAGTAPLTGLLSQYFFLGGVWDKLDVQMDVERIGAYKTAADMLVNKTMTAAHREMANSLLDSINGQFIGGIAAARGLDAAAVQAVIDDCPITPKAFAATGLSDGSKFLDQIREELVGPAGKFIDADDYQQSSRSWLGMDTRPELAVIYAVGPIQSGETSDGVGGQSVGAETLVEAFDKAADDDSAKAIVFRINSPGGSALASDLIWRATEKARTKKPIIVSMSDVAGSGGYYIAVGGNEIVAQPATLTGSIGVLVAKPNISGLLGKLGVTTATLTRGKFARLEDATSSLTPEERQKVVGAMDHIYELFVDRVAQGRRMSPDRVNQLGQGRVWTGAQAKENGLVDDLGGFTRAIDVAKEAAGIPSDQDVQLVVYPQPKSLVQRVAQYVDARSTVRLPAVLERVAEMLAPLRFRSGSLLTLMGEVIEVR
jgi:protease IV